MIQNPNQWFPHFSPSGKIASGAGQSWAEGKLQLEPAWYSRWLDDERIVCNAADHEAKHAVINTVTGVKVFKQPGASLTAAGGGRYAVWLAGGGPGNASWGKLYAPDNTEHDLPAGIDRPYIGRDGNVVWATPYQSNIRDLYFNGTKIHGGQIIVEPTTEAGVVVWSEYTRASRYARSTRGWRGQGVEDLMVMDPIGTEFISYPIPTPVGLFVFTAAHWGFFIRPWGQKIGWLFVGEAYNPDVICLGDTIYVAASTGAGAPLMWPFPMSAPMVDIRKHAPFTGEDTPPPPPPPPPPGDKPVPFPDIRATQDRVRAKYPALVDHEQCAKIMNEVAWIHRHEGVGLFRKEGGNRTSQPRTGIQISVDWLVHKESKTGGDFFGSAPGFDENDRPTKEPMKPQTPELKPVDISRFVDPVEPEEGSEEPVATHKYDGGGNDTGTCDRCGKGRHDPVHTIPESKQKHDYDGGEQDTGQCDICHNDRNHPLHQRENPQEPDGERHKFVGEGRFCGECGQKAEAEIHKVKQEPVPTGDLGEVVRLLKEILESNKRQEQKLDDLRTGVINAVKEELPKIIGNLGGLGGLLGGGGKSKK